jgi:hypothetical protein
MPQLGAAGLDDRSSPPTIATVLEKLQSALQKSRIDRASTRPTARGGLELSTGTGPYVRRPYGRVSVDPVMSGCVV